MVNLSSKFIAILIFMAISLWIGSGFIPSLANKKESPDNTYERSFTTPKVGIKNSVAQKIWSEVTLFGTTQSYRKVALKSQTHGKVEAIHISEGGHVNKGDIILSLAVEDRKKNLKSAEALLEQRQLEYNVAKSLKNSGHQSKTKLSLAKANLESAVANLYTAQTEYENIFIKAPFNGFIQELNVEVGDFMHQSGSDLATIIDDKKILAVAHIPERKISGIELGKKAFIKTVNGINTRGFVSYISKIADPITRTFKIELEIINEDYNFFEGMTTKIRIPVKEIYAHLINPSFFSLDDSGEIGVKTLSDDNSVNFYPINIIKEDENGVWITGLPEVAKVITHGQAFLKIGDKAKVADSE
jgi:multidrug efflux system membrane fusion protein